MFRGEHVLVCIFIFRLIKKESIVLHTSAYDLRCQWQPMKKHMISTKYSPIHLEAFYFAQVQNSFLQSVLQL
jgi:hypothetical protein